MALVPDRLDEFQTAEFWDAFFKARSAKPFEWYCAYASLRPHILHHCRGKRVLIPGCGNSDLSAALYDDGVEDITNLDFSKPVIREMLTKNVRQRPKMKWMVMDITQMKFPDGSYDVVLDKGALDALMGDSESDSTAKAEAYLTEVLRLLKANSVFFCVSLLQRHVLRFLLGHFRYSFQICVQGLEMPASEQVSEIQSFLFIAERKLGHEDLPCIQLSLPAYTAQQHEIQLKDIQEVVRGENAVRREGRSAHGHQGDHRDFDALYPGRRVEMESMKCPFSKKLKKKLIFRAVVLDNPGSFHSTCAVYLVPRGQEQSWLYRSAEGQWVISQHCQVKRLILVSLDADDWKHSLEDLKDGLSAGLKHLIPIDIRFLPKATPFLTSNGETDTYYDRAHYSSAISGDIIVRDCLKEDQILRRLVFADNASLIQSEIALHQIGPDEKLESGGIPDVDHLTVDYDSLPALYHQVIVSGLQALSTKGAGGDRPRGVLIGLGGGVLPMYLHSHFNIDLITVELDPTLLEVCKKWFGIDDSLSVRIGDGIDYIQHLSDQGMTVDLVVVDAGGSDDGDGMACPPRPFVDRTFLDSAAACLSGHGMLVMNFVARSIAAYETAVKAIKDVFVSVYAVKVDEDINRVVFASNGDLDFSQGLEKLFRGNWQPRWNLDQALERLSIA